jgi:hypothetical protein
MFAFTAINEWANIGLIRASLFLVDRLEKLQHAPATLGFIGAVIPPVLHTTAVNPTCSGTLMTPIKTGASNIVAFLTGLGIFITVIGIIIGGLMRATAFGNERRIAASNTAITGAVVGIVIVVLAVAAGQSIPTWFGGSTTGCELTSPGAQATP